MRCPHCNAAKTGVRKTKEFVSESMPDPVNQRRRVCLSCEKPFYTYEVYSHDWRKVTQIMESADLLEQLSGLIRTRLKIKSAKPKKDEEP